MVAGKTRRRPGGADFRRARYRQVTAQTALERISGEPHTRLRYFCSPHHRDSALYPAITQLERAAGFQREDNPEQRLDKLEAVLAQGTNDLTEAAPLLADLLSIPTGDRYPRRSISPRRSARRKPCGLIAQVRDSPAGRARPMIRGPPAGQRDRR